MLKKEFYIATLITAELDGSLSPEEGRELEQWKNTSAENLEFYNNFTADEEFLREFKKFSRIDTNNIWELTAAGLKARLEPQIHEVPARRVRLWPRIAGIAAAVTALAVCIYFFNALRGSGTGNKSQYETAASHIKPGGNGATITLANGKTIELSDVKDGVVIGDGKLAYNDGSEIREGEISEQLTASTVKGQTYIFILPDGTKVWLNADSKISFAQQLTKKTREVFLEGEAYFEVAKDKRHPFMVTSKGQQIEVLGTHFNVNSYADEPVIATTLLEGSVKIRVGNTQSMIKPGQQAINKSGVVEVRQADVDNVIDWRNGDFYLNHVEFKTAMRKIARWYNMDIVYDDDVPDNMESGGWIARDKPLSAVLKSIESSGLVKFRIAGRKIYVTQ